MIVRIMSNGKSFKGLAAYLTHDPKAKTAERVAWTHTLNLANDHVPSAVDEMLWTMRDAELLKQQAGVRGGGRSTENAVKHISLNWSPEEKPTREQMLEATGGFLKHMHWDEHQSIIVAHDDRAHSHVHIALNTVHPETGLKLNDGFERRRAQAWALEYEKENGRIFCEQRTLDPAERQDAPTREAWQGFRENERDFNSEENARRLQNVADDNNPDSKAANFADWKKLKELQKQERIEYFAQGKKAFSDLRYAIYGEVREEFRERWAEFYSAKGNGGDAEALEEMKARILAEQRQMLKERSDEACAELRASRAADYRELLDDQREIRFGLRNRQELGLDTGLFFEKVAATIHERAAGGNRAADPAREDMQRDAANDNAAEGSPRENRHHVKSATTVSTDVGEGVGLGILALFSSMADGLVGANAVPERRKAEPERHNSNRFDDAASKAAEQQRIEREQADEEYYKRRARE